MQNYTYIHIHILMDHSPNGIFQDQWKQTDESNAANEHNMVENPNQQEADQLAVCKRGRGVEEGSTKKHLQLSGQSGT